jgi:two-component system cell cycle response regulator
MSESGGLVDQQRTVLIVDDRPDNLSVFLDILGRAGFRVLVAEDGEAALEQAPLISPDVIFLDVMMPGIDGFETCRRLKRIEETRDVPVILVTALSDTADRLRGFAAGGVDYVTKPFRSEEILARAVVHADLTRARRRMRQAHALLAERAPALDEDSAVAGALELLKMG